MISVIVPIYNVEKYLPKCLDSLINQTYADVEFILIDDGSTDSSGKIADSYKDRDPRFKVFHTENHGLSAARNYGIEHSKGEWLMFVDSDDWVSPSFCETPMKAAIEYNADLIDFRVNSVKNGKIHPDKTDKIPAGIITFEQAMIHANISTWNKLYRRKLFENVRFPEGMVYEDVATTHRLLHNAGRIALLHDHLYYYVFRENSISHVRSQKNKRDGFLTCLQRYNDLISYGYSGYDNELLLWSRTISYLIAAEPDKDQTYRKAEEVLASFGKIPKTHELGKKIMFAVWKTDKRLFNWICRVFARRTSQ